MTAINQLDEIINKYRKLHKPRKIGGIWQCACYENNIQSGRWCPKCNRCHPMLVANINNSEEKHAK